MIEPVATSPSIDTPSGSEPPQVRALALWRLAQTACWRGGDTSFSYSGSWKQEGNRFTANLISKRFAAGPSVFGLEEVEITVEGRSTAGVAASCTGLARQAPGVKLDVTLVRMSGD